MEIITFKTAAKYITSFFKGEEKNTEVVTITERAHDNAKASWAFGVGVTYDGEKNFGEIGPVKDYYLIYEALRLRGYEAKLTNEVAQTILSKYRIWVIGDGLRLKSEPEKDALLSEGIEIDPEIFNKGTETRFKVWAKSNISSRNRKDNLYSLSSKAFDAAITGGDCLWILRYEKKNLNIEIKDGCHLQSPGMESYLPNEQGFYIKNGIEFNKAGVEVAYHIRTKDYKYVRLEAYNSQGLKVVGLIYGNQHRIDDNRGISVLSASFETLAKLDRYKEATVGSAEEQAKITYQVVHGKNSIGDNPFQTSLVKLAKTGYNASNESEQGVGDAFSKEGQQLAETVAKTTNKQAINNTQDSEIKPLMASSGQFYFKEFILTNIDIIAAGIGIPPNVAMSLYNDSFSASRAATKDWEHTLKIKRAEFVLQFLQHVYNFWLHLEVLKNKISAPGYIQAFMEENEMVLAAYRNCRFTGDMFPHIDPLKEVNAERAKLGEAGKHIPFTTQEAAVENLGGDEGGAIIRQFATELKEAAKLGIEPVVKENPDDTSDKEDDKPDPKKKD